jgi:hypothetical protein
VSYSIDFTTFWNEFPKKKDVFEFDQIKNHYSIQLDGFQEKYRLNDKINASLLIADQNNGEPLEHAYIKVYYETEDLRRFLVNKVTCSIPTIKPIKIAFKFGKFYPISPKFRFLIVIIHNNKLVGFFQSATCSLENPIGRIPVKVIKFTLDQPLLILNTSLIPIITLDTNNIIGSQKIYATVSLIGEGQEPILKQNKFTFTFNDQMQNKLLNIPLCIKMDTIPEGIKSVRLHISLSYDQISEDGTTEDYEFYSKKVSVRVNKSVEGIYPDFVGFKRDALEIGQSERVFDTIKNNRNTSLKGKVDVSMFSAISGSLSVIKRKISVNPEDHLDIVELRQPPFSFALDYLWVIAHNVLNCKSAGKIDFIGISEKGIPVNIGNVHPMIVRIRANNSDKFLPGGTYLACELFVKFDYPINPDKFIITLYENYENISRIKLSAFPIKDVKFGKAFNFHWKLPKKPGFYFIDVEIQMDNRIFTEEIPGLLEISTPSYHVIEQK